jgi:hypothetical protein
MEFGLFLPWHRFRQARSIYNIYILHFPVISQQRLVPGWQENCFHQPGHADDVILFAVAFHYVIS